MRKLIKIAVVGAGAPIVALCLGAGTAWAEPSTEADSPTTDETPSPIPGLSGLALSAGGMELVQFGDAHATTSGPSVALAMNDSTAEAHGFFNFAFAGDGSTSSVTGAFSDARAAFGSSSSVSGGFNNHVYSIPNSDSAVGDGNNRIVASLCGGSVVSAQSNRITTSAPCVGG